MLALTADRDRQFEVEPQAGERVALDLFRDDLDLVGHLFGINIHAHRYPPRRNRASLVHASKRSKRSAFTLARGGRISWCHSFATSTSRASAISRRRRRSTGDTRDPSTASEASAPASTPPSSRRATWSSGTCRPDRTRPWPRPDQLRKREA